MAQLRAVYRVNLAFADSKLEPCWVTWDTPVLLALYSDAKIALVEAHVTNGFVLGKLSNEFAAKYFLLQIDFGLTVRNSQQ